MRTSDPFDLERFVKAQSPVFETALAEIRAGEKRSHWMWFIFPQLRGLGRSSTAQLYGIASIDEARAYIAHALLGPRLTLCTEAVTAIDRRSLSDIFGSPDDMKFRSSMSLFALAVVDGGSVYRQALQQYCDGDFDRETLTLLKMNSRHA